MVCFLALIFYKVVWQHMQGVVEHVQYGIIVDSSLKFDKHISLIVHKAMNRSRLILKCFHSGDRVLLTTTSCIYVRPILEYCSLVWSPHFKYLITKIEHVQRYFTKRLKGCWTAVEQSISGISRTSTFGY